MNPQSSVYSSANNHQTPSNRSQIAPSSFFRILTFTLYRRPVHFLPTPPNDPSTLTTLPVYTYVHLCTRVQVWAVCVSVGRGPSRNTEMKIISRSDREPLPRCCCTHRDWVCVDHTLKSLSVQVNHRVKNTPHRAIHCTLSAKIKYN